MKRSVASMLDRGPVNLTVVSQNGMWVRVADRAAGFRRKSRHRQLHAAAHAQVEALKKEVEAIEVLRWRGTQGVVQFEVHGLQKARAVPLWRTLDHNLMHK